jgi:DedD protein
LNTRYETEHDLHDLHEHGENDREISLGATTILGIFFALALLCAVFFGFGYSLGRKSAQSAAVPAETTTGSTSNPAKPSPGSSSDQPISFAKPAAGASQSAIVPTDSQSDALQQDSQPLPDSAPVKPVVSAPRLSVHTEPVAVVTTKSPAMTPVSTAAPSPGSLVVQVAAMSHQEDADVVAVDLKRRGYTVAIRREPQDKLFHVQIGPFSNKKEADAMRLRLQTDGYNNAIVK